MKQVYTLCLCVGLWFCGSVTSLGSSLSGYVLDDDGNPISYATIYQTRTNAHDHTDDLGRFYLADVIAGDTVTIEALGYTLRRLSVDAATASTGRVSVNMQTLGVTLTQIEVKPQVDAAKLVQDLDLRTRPATNSQELLRTVPGLVIGQHAGGGKSEQMFLRGFDIDHGTDIAIRVDGSPVNMVSHAHGQGYADLHYVIPETVEKVDFTKGPHDARFGNFATAASVEFRTKDVLRQNLLQVDAGQFNTLRGVAMISLLNRERDHAYIAVEGIRTDGFFVSSQDFRRLNAFAKTDHRLKNGARLNLSASHFTSEWLASGQIPLRAVADGTISRFGAIDDTEGGNTSRSNVNAIYRAPVGKTGLLSARAYGSRYDFELFSNFTFFLVDPVNGDEIRQAETRYLGGTDVRYENIAKIATQDIRYEFGVQSRFDATDNSLLSRTLQRNTLLEELRRGDIAEQSGGAYATVETDVEDFTFMLGLRADVTRYRYTDALEGGRTDTEVADALQPKFQIHYRPEQRVQAFLKLGSGYHANDARIVTGTTDRIFMPRAYGADLGVIVQPADALVLTATAWTLRSQQEFVYVGDAGVVEPSGRSQRMGLDLGARLSLQKDLAIGADLTLAHARAIDEPEDANRIPLAPPLALGAYAVYQPGTGWHGSARLRLVGDRAANEDYSITAVGYEVLDLVAGYTYRKVSLDLIVDNSFNTKWNETQFATESRLKNEPAPVEEIHFTPGTPRAVRVRLGYRF